MKLYIETAQGRFYLPFVAKSRAELQQALKLDHFVLADGSTFKLSDIKAEPESRVYGKVIVGSFVGAAFGVLGGLGAITLGSILGAFTGSRFKSIDEIDAMKFNDSKI